MGFLVKLKPDRKKTNRSIAQGTFEQLQQTASQWSRS
jgi:hypothetical protein